MNFIRRTIVMVLVAGLVPAALARDKSNSDMQANTPQHPCVILKRMGPADEVTSHLYAFGLRGKQFQYVEGQLPAGVKFHGRLTDNDVRNIQKTGAPVEILEAHYSDTDLQQARKACGNPNADTAPAVAPSSVTVKSNPDGADITVDGKYSGSTPSKIALTTGDHTIAIHVAGYAPWQRTITIKPGDDINMSATLENIHATKAN